MIKQPFPTREEISHYLEKDRTKDHISGPELAALGILSACALAHEVLLSRLFAVQQFHHFSFLVISLAILGIGAGGASTALWPSRSLTTPAISFSAGMILTYAIINLAPFDSYTIALDTRQIAILILTLTSVSMPFFMYGRLVAALLSSAGKGAYLTYAVNLAGSGLGCLLALGTLSILREESAYLLVSALALIGSAILLRSPTLRFITAGFSAILLFTAFMLPARFQLLLSPYKSLSQFRLQPGTVEILQVSSPSARINVIESPSLHSYPGLSLNYHGPLPDQLALFIDGNGPYPITLLDPASSTALDLADAFPGSLAYNMRPQADILILQPGTGFEALLAFAAGAGHITISTPEDQVNALMLGPLLDSTHRLYTTPGLVIGPHADRSTLQHTQAVYDLVIFPLSEPYHPITSGAFSLTEDYTLTVESIAAALDNLNEKGLLVITRWLGTLPSDSLKTWLTVLEAMKQSGISSPETNLIALRSMRTASILASPDPFSSTDLQTLQMFLEENGFDPIYFPDIQENDLNRFNQLPEDIYHTLFMDALQSPQQAIQTNDLKITPPDDNQPYFHHFFRWRQIPGIMQSLGKIWQPFGGSGYLVLLLMMSILILLCAGITSVPLLLQPTMRPSTQVTLFFALVGAAFMLVEIPLLQQFTLLFDKPAYAMSFILFTILLSSGMGSLTVPVIRSPTVLFLLPVLHGIVAFTLPAVISQLLSQTLWLQILASFLLLFPVGFLMGIPFSLGLRICEFEKPGAIPLAYAVNGAFSGFSGVLAALLTLELGFKETLLAGASTYLLAFLLLPPLKKITRTSSQGSC